MIFMQKFSTLTLVLNPNHDYCHFSPVLLADQITDIDNEMCVQASRFTKVWSQIIKFE